MRSRRITVGLLCFAALLMTVSVLPAAGATQQSGGADEHRQVDPDEARLVAEGTGLTIGEATRLIALEPHVDRLRQDLTSRFPDRLAAVWMDIQDHGRVKVDFKGKPPADALRGFPHPELADLGERSRSLSELEGIKAEISDEALELREQGYAINSVAVDVQNNKVLVGATNPEDVEAELGRRYPPGAFVVKQEDEVKPAACTDRSDCFPWRGGIELIDTWGGTLCSSSFVITANSTTNGSSYEGLLTAGHCFPSDNRGITHSTSVVGTAEPGRDQYAGSVDGMVILHDVGLLDPADLQPRIFRSSTQMWWGIFSDAGLSNGGVGSSVCHSGITRGERCGTITLESVDFFVGLTRFTDFREDNICTLPGDSGGAVFHANVAHGIMNFSNFVEGSSGPECASTPRTKYTQLYYAERDLGMQIQHGTP